MQHVLSIVLQCVAATSIMTAFSYALSAITRQQFREPEMLNQLADPQRKAAGAIGWGIHYFVGLLFILAYEALFAQRTDAPAVYLLAGFISGLLGVAGWYTTLTLHPHPPNINRAAFYVQLVPAHIIFALGAYVAR
jgi:hypothetical protein